MSMSILCEDGPRNEARHKIDKYIWLNIDIHDWFQWFYYIAHNF